MINLKSTSTTKSKRFDEVAIAALIGIVLELTPMSGRAVMRSVNGTGTGAGSHLTHWRRGTYAPSIVSFARVMSAVGFDSSTGLRCCLDVSAQMSELDDVTSARELTFARVEQELEAQAADVVARWIEHQSENVVELIEHLEDVGSISSLILSDHIKRGGASLIDIEMIRSALIDQRSARVREEGRAA